MKAAGYLRCSSEEQADSGLGLAAQEIKARSYALMRGLTLDRVIVDAGVSAGIPLNQRPGGAELLALTGTRKPTIEVVIVLKLDRIFRRVLDCLEVIEDWDARNVSLHIIDLGGCSIDTKTAAGKFILTMLAAAGEMERNLGIERTTSALAVLKANGEAYGTVPFGYRRSIEYPGGIKKAGKGAPRANLLPDSLEQAVIERLRELRASGLTLREVASTAAGEGIRGRSGAPLSVPAIHAILKRGASEVAAGRTHDSELPETEAADFLEAATEE